MTGEFDELSAMIIDGNPEAAHLSEALVSEGTSASRIIDEGLMPAMEIVGERMKTGESFIPEVLLSARTMQACLAVLKPHLAAGDDSTRGTVVIGTVEGDVHDIGKNIVTLMLRGAGFHVVDLGIGVRPGDFVQAVRDHEADLVGMSALLTTTMPRMRDVIVALEGAGIRNRVGVLIGGAPVHDGYAKEIGADAAGANAVLAVELAKQLVGGRCGSER